MIENKEKISIHQMQIIMILNIFGSSMLIFPKILLSASSSSFIYAMITGLILIIFTTFIILYSMSIYHYENFFVLLENVFGLIFAKIICVLLLIKVFVSLLYSINLFSKMNTSILLPKTSPLLINIIFMFVCAYLCVKGQSVRSKANQLFFYLIAFFVLFFIMISVPQITTKNLPNMLDADMASTFSGSIITFLSFSSIIYFYFDYYYVENRKNIIKKSINSVVLAFLLFFIITVITVSTFTINGALSLDFPTFDAMSKVFILGTFITRNEALVITLWIFILFCFISSCLFYSTVLFRYIFSKDKTKLYIFICSVITIILYSLNIDIYYINIINFSLSILFMFFLPSILIFSKYVKTRKVLVLMLLVFMPLLSSCSDKIELEDRRFVLLMSIDKKGEDFLITYAYPSIESENEQTLITLSTEGKTLLSAIDKANVYNKNFLDFRQIKTIVLSKDILEDDKMLKDVFDVLSKNNQVSSNTYIVAYDGKASSIIESKKTRTESLSHFLINYYKNYDNTYKTAVLADLDSILLKVRNDEPTYIPVVEDKEIHISKSVIIENFTFKGFISNDILKGYALLEKNGSEMPFEFFYNDESVYAKVVNSKPHISFTEENDKLVVNYKINAKCVLLDYVFDYSNKEDTKVINKLISDEILLLSRNTLNYYIKNNIDGLYLKEHLRRKNPSLYEKYNNDDFYNNLSYKIDVKTTLSN